MKSALGFDPGAHDYGPASRSVQEILAGWEAIDWFAPAGKNAHDATQLFEEHNRLGHAFAPGLFSRYVEVECRAGDWAEFIAWCTRMRSRSTGWDWKFSVLKRLSIVHAGARGWKLDEQIARDVEDGPSPGDLFIRHRGPDQSFVAWRGVMPRLAELESRRGDRVADAADFYLRYAHDDVIRCIQWQLAERSNVLDSNPFVPLLACYRAGFYPFGLTRDTALLFRFARPALPAARSAPLHSAH